jgi:hypothetical protein
MRILPHNTVKSESGECLLHILEHHPKKGCGAICCMPKQFLTLYKEQNDVAISGHIMAKNTFSVTILFENKKIVTNDLACTQMT